MAVIKCKMCGGDLVLTEGSTIAECEYCGSLQTVPSADNERKMTLFARANRLRANCEYDKAAGVYESIIVDFPEEAEAYWGLLLCRFGIEYVDDPATGKKIPTCHRSSFSSILEDDDFDLTLENADPVARKVYREEAKQIETLRKDILEVSSKEDPYDIFICYKETADDGQRTLDSVLAQDIYDALTEKGYRVFFSRITLEDKLGQEFEPYIFAALHSAKVMLSIGTDYEYFNAVWVRNEWSRYLKLMENDKTKHLIPCFKDLDAYDMPKEFAKLQAQDLGKVGAIQDLLRGIDKLIGTSGTATVVKEHSLDVAAQLERGDQALQEKDWKIAANRFDLALVADPECAEAYVGKLLVERKLKEKSKLSKQRKRLHKNSNFRQALRYANDSLKQELLAFDKAIKKRNLIKTITATCIAVALFFSGWTVLEIFCQNIENRVYNNTISPEYANECFSRLQWYIEDDNAAAFLTAILTEDAALQQAFRPSTLELNEHTLKIFCLRNDSFDFSFIKEITVMSGITQLPRKVFSGLAGLETVTIPDSVTEIDESAFEGCTSLTSITIPDSVTEIGSSAFEGCTSLKEITLPKFLNKIQGFTFQGCASLASITIPDSVTDIGSAAFEGCSGLVSVTLPDNLTVLQSSTFSDCVGLTSVTIPDGVTRIDRRAFYNCENLASVTIPDSITEISSYAFAKCISLASVTIPNSLTKIEYATFYECLNLASITIPDSVTAISSDAFYGCASLSSIDLPDGLSSIGSSAFSGCTRLTSITIPSSVKYIMSYTFRDCTGLATAKIPASVRSIDADAFYGCTSLKTVYCAVKKVPSLWSKCWLDGCGADVVWGYTG